MKTIKIVLATLILTISLSCKGESKQKTKEIQTEEISEVNYENKTVIEPDVSVNNTLNTIKIEETSENTETVDKVYIDFDFPYIIQDFIICRSNTTDRNLCRNEITKVISETYGLEEFKNTKQKYVIYDSIQPIIKRSNLWKNAGVATNQKVLNKALEHTNNGGLSLVIDTSESYGHVVMIVPGKAKKSGSWGLNLPPVLSLLNYKPEKSFCNKSLSYALKKSDNLQVYIRE